MHRTSGSTSAFSRSPAGSPRSLVPVGAPPPPVSASDYRGDASAVLNGMRRYYLHLLTSPEASPRARVSISPTDARRPQKKRKARAMTSSERGLKFRKEQQERQEQLVTSTDKLRREIARLEALKDMRKGLMLITSFTEGGAPLRFALEYFAQFRFGVAGESNVPVSMMMTTAEQQLAFLRAMVEPEALFNGVPAVTFVISSFSQKKKLSSFRIERESSELLSIDNSAIVVTKGVSHMRYSRHTIEQLFPHVLDNEELVRKLVGRQLHMPFKVSMFFNKQGKLSRGEFERDAVAGMYEVLRDVKDCAALFGEEAVDRFLAQQKSEETRWQRREEVITADAERFEELVDDATDRADHQAVTQDPGDRPDGRASAPPAAPMDLKFILS